MFVDSPRAITLDTWTVWLMLSHANRLGEAMGRGDLDASDRRRSIRVALSHSGYLHCRGKRLSITVTDLCHHGARVSGDGIFKVGDLVTLELVLACGPLLMVSSVVWNTNARRRHAGLCFGSVTPAQLQRLDDVACGPTLDD